MENQSTRHQLYIGGTRANTSTLASRHHTPTSTPSRIHCSRHARLISVVATTTLSQIHRNHYTPHHLRLRIVVITTKMDEPIT
ncbi:hypothetical protein QL285_002407 [Trifolium repens]|nr:hypothetical protein QL285_002407 [Trifolium repens]